MSRTEFDIEKLIQNDGLKERLDQLGIKAVIFDLDDTLIVTSDIFARYMNEYVERVAAETETDPQTIDECLRRLNDEEYKKMGVNPARWNVVVERMAKELVGCEKSIIGNLPSLMKIYDEKPKVRPGTKATLEGLKRTGIKIGLVTHANTDWTWSKLEGAGIINYLDSITIADENGHKGVEHWESNMLDLDVFPRECLVVGDNLGGDIIPTSKIGSRTIWLHKGSTWSIYRTGEVPKDTVVIDSVVDFLSAIDLMR